MAEEKRSEELSNLRAEILDITLDIITKAHKRMKLSEQIGTIKGNLNIEIEDERVEQEVRRSVIELSHELGVDPAFSGRLLNMLLMESIRLQQIQHKKKGNNPMVATHLSVFMKAKEMESLGKKIIHLEVGEPDYSPPRQIRNALIESYNKKRYHYTEPRGLLKLRQAIAKKVGHGIDQDEVIVTTGGRFALFSAILSILRPGEEVISIEPSWPAYREFVDFAGGKVKTLGTTLENNWTPDTRQLEEMIDRHTKIIVLNYPNNPTGKILEGEDMTRIVSLAQDNGLYVISDEVYSEYAFKGFTSLTHFEYDKSIVVSSFSKSCAMTGFRVGYGIADKEIISKMARIQAIALTSVAEPMQYAALSAIDYDPARNVKLIKERLDLISEKLTGMSLDFVSPDGAMYVFPRIRGLIQNDITLVNKLLDLGVAVAPGSGFGQDYTQFIRISACQPKKLLARGLDAINSVLFVH
jgi:aspartate aminotransferase